MGWLAYRGPQQGQGIEQVPQRGGRAEPTPPAELTVDGLTTAPNSINLVLFESLARNELEDASPINEPDGVDKSDFDLPHYSPPPRFSEPPKSVKRRYASRILSTLYLFAQPPNICINNKEGCQYTSNPHPKSTSSILFTGLH
jgi:hypothetical protein